MTRLERLEKYGWKITSYMSGRGCIATRHMIKIKGTSISDLHRKIFGY